ncbi:hypothetical protein [Yoonia sp. BS5-3]|uniref:Co-chaperone DjlA N-terminal domain-containing protein n=1 Tax=Yoonia phaeophyticola TaxID=3137369 RepID=A0ABZ2V0L5_9RHOB
MPFIILILTTLGGALWWWVRQNPDKAIYAAQDAVTTVRNAPRKLAFRKQTNAHPVEGIDDPRIAVCGLAQAFLELDDLPTAEQRTHLNTLLRTKLRCSAEEAEEMEVLGRWLMAQCQSPDAAVTRLARRLHKIDGDASWDVLQDILTDLVGGTLNTSQVNAISDMKRAFHM